MLEGIPLVYAELDLGLYDEAYAGRQLTLLQNPSREFRSAYLRSTYDTNSGEWLQLLGQVLHTDAPEQVLAPLPNEIIVWLFIGLLEGYDEKTRKFETYIRPYLLEVWDTYVRARVKAHTVR